MLISKLPGIVSRVRLLKGRKPLAGRRSDYFWQKYRQSQKIQRRNVNLLTFVSRHLSRWKRWICTFFHWNTSESSVKNG